MSRKSFLSVIIFISVFSLVSCSKYQYDYLGIAKIEMTSNIYTENPQLELYLFTSSKYDEVLLESSNSIESIQSTKYSIILNDQHHQFPGYLYLFNITFEKKELVITKLNFQIQGTKYEIKIGTYQTLIIEPSTLDINSYMTLNQDEVLITYQNNLEKTIYFEKYEKISPSKHHQLLFDFKGYHEVIYHHQLKSLKFFKLKIIFPYYQVSGIIKTTFKTNLEDHDVLSSYYYNGLPPLTVLQNTGIDISSLDKIK